MWEACQSGRYPSLFTGDFLADSNFVSQFNYFILYSKFSYKRIVSYENYSDNSTAFVGIGEKSMAPSEKYGDYILK